jgi:hypothetical protein
MGKQMFMMKSKVVRWPSVLSDDLVRSVVQKNCERECFTISELSHEFPQISHTVLYETITLRLGYHKSCARWVPKMFTGAHKMQRTALALTFFKAIPQRWQ